MCTCAVSAFMCFSGKKMPGATNSHPQKPMPSPTCCYCGIRIKTGRPLRHATPEQRRHAAQWRASADNPPLLHSLHVCNTHDRHPPDIPPPTAVRSKMRTALSVVSKRIGSDQWNLTHNSLRILLLRVYSHAQQLQQSLQDVCSATSPTSLLYLSPHLHAALRALPASVRSTHICHL